MSNDILYTQLTMHGLNVPDSDMKEEILKSDDVLAGIAGLVNNHGESLRVLIQSRVAHLKSYLIMEATPAEVLIFRQCMMEVAQIFDDAIKYQTEYMKRIKESGEGAPPEAPPIADNGVDTQAEDNGAQME